MALIYHHYVIIIFRDFSAKAIRKESIYRNRLKHYPLHKVIGNILFEEKYFLSLPGGCVKTVLCNNVKSGRGAGPVVQRLCSHVTLLSPWFRSIIHIISFIIQFIAPELFSCLPQKKKRNLLVIFPSQRRNTIFSPWSVPGDSKKSLRTWYEPKGLVSTAQLNRVSSSFTQVRGKVFSLLTKYFRSHNLESQTRIYVLIFKSKTEISS